MYSSELLGNVIEGALGIKFSFTTKKTIKNLKLKSFVIDSGLHSKNSIFPLKGLCVTCAVDTNKKNKNWQHRQVCIKGTRLFSCL